MSGHKIIINDYAREPVPKKKLRGIWEMTAVWTAGMICVPVILMGIQIGGSLNFSDALIAIFAGQFILTVIIAITSYIGASLKLSTAMIMENTFGRVGSYIPSLLLVISILGWFAFHTEIFGLSLQSMLHENFGLSLPLWPLTFLGGMLMSTTAILGFRAVSFLSKVSIPALVLLLVVPFINLLSKQDISVLWENSTEPTMSIGTTISFIVGGLIVGTTVAPDFNRYSDTPKNAIYSNSMVFMLLTPILLVTAMFLSASSGETNFSSIMYAAGWGAPAMLTLILATWTTNDSNLYLSSLSLSSIIKKYPKWQLAGASGIIATIIACFGVIQHYVPCMLFLGISFAPMAGVYASDYFFGHRKYTHNNFDTLPTFRILPFISWITGSLIGILVTPASSGGLELMTISTIPALDAIVAAALIHIALLKIVPIKKYTLAMEIETL